MFSGQAGQGELRNAAAILGGRRLGESALSLGMAKNDNPTAKRNELFRLLFRFPFLISGFFAGSPFRGPSLLCRQPADVERQRPQRKQGHQAGEKSVVGSLA